MLMTISSIAQACAAEVVVPGAPDSKASSVVWDSREVVPGCTFAALVGQKVDGHRFIPQAIQGGAACVLMSHQVDADVVRAAEQAGCALLLVPETTEQAITAIAKAWRRELSGTVIAVTGSSGKTTTKNLIATVLGAGMPTVATLANQNNELGVPRTLLRADADTRAVVVEMGMRGSGQIDELCRFVRPDISVITNVGESHIELLGSRENIARAKGEALANLPEGGWAFLNMNNDYASAMLQWAHAEERNLHVCLFGRKEAAVADLPAADKEVWAQDVRLDDAGMPSFALCCGEAQLPCTMSMPGLHNVDNALCAAALGLHMGMDMGEVVCAIESAQSVAGRQNVHRLASGVTVIDDAYNANPDSMAASLRTFAAMKAEGRHIAILGDMGELGSFSSDGHKRMGALVASLGASKLICVGELSKDLAMAAIEGGMSSEDVQLVPDWKGGLEAAAALVRPGDCVLVKASHSMELEHVVEGLITTC